MVGLAWVYITIESIHTQEDVYTRIWIITSCAGIFGLIMDWSLILSLQRTKVDKIREL